MREKLLRVTYIFATSKLQVIASLLYKIGAHVGQYFGYLSPKVSEDQKKRSLPQIRADFCLYYGNLSQKEGEDPPPQKKGLLRKSELISRIPNKTRFWFRL